MQTSRYIDKSIVNIWIGRRINGTMEEKRCKVGKLVGPTKSREEIHVILGNDNQWMGYHKKESVTN